MSLHIAEKETLRLISANRIISQQKEMFDNSSVQFLQVEILVGKDRGKQGVINCIIKERNWCYVEGLNCVSMISRLPFMQKAAYSE